MISFPSTSKVIQKSKNQAVFEIAGLYPGYGVTIGNALRRVLLSSLEGVAVTEVKIKGVTHEFSTLPGVLEDVIMILLNIKNLRFKIHEGDTYRLELSIKGEKEVRGADFKLPSQVELVNPELHIATVTNRNTELAIEIKIEKGIGYEPRDQRKARGTEASVRREIGVIAVDAIFTPIRNVNFQVENMRVGERTDFDRLSLQIETDGTIDPQTAFYESCDILIKHFNTLASGKKITVPKVPEMSEESDLTKTTVEELKLSKKTLNALLDNGIKTIGGIIRKSEKSLSKLDSMGPKAISEIKRKLKKLKLELKTE